MKDQLLRRLISPFPPDSVYRRIGKRIVQRFGLSARQKFYSGIIYFDAVGQSWAFKGDPYETIDCQLKDALLSLAKDRQVYIDIGCNIGQITLSLLLRNSDIKAVCVDPNPRVLRLFKKSLRANHLEGRVTIKQAAVGNEAGFVRFSCEISEIGHIASKGYKVPCLCLADLINDYSSQKCLVKMDVEGYEAVLLQGLGQYRNLKNLILVVELHALGQNQGDPERCVKMLEGSGAKLKLLNGEPLSSLDPTKITQVIASWE